MTATMRDLEEAVKSEIRSEREERARAMLREKLERLQSAERVFKTLERKYHELLDTDLDALSLD